MGHADTASRSRAITAKKASDPGPGRLYLGHPNRSRGCEDLMRLRLCCTRLNTTSLTDSPRCLSAPTSRRGFTLVELVVVVSIITLLIAILLPAMKQAKTNARTVRCQINERQLMQAQHMYASDNYGIPAHSNWLSNENGGANDMKYAGWLYKWPKRAKLKDIEAGALWRYLNDYDIYRCQEHAKPWGGTERITSYCLNGSLVFFGKNNYAFPLNRWRPDDIWYWETDENSNWWNDGSNFPREFATGRHDLGGNRGAGNVATMDGGVEWLSIQDYHDLAFSSKRTRLWNVPNDANGR
ncbi:MAG: prepilin-type N-terminal cleavage/methylation domain-containing protein [Phycisphaera sp.]|nr:prepilin-type N-terminal cleavage/methylation domain-containing protein [Phycisphaera sp.]